MRRRIQIREEQDQTRQVSDMQKLQQDLRSSRGDRELGSSDTL